MDAVTILESDIGYLKQTIEKLKARLRVREKLLRELQGK